MKPSIKAVLFSALIFPGAGHFLLKRYLSGIVLLGITLVALGLLIHGPLQTAMAITDKIERGEVSMFDTQAITELVNAAQATSDGLIGNIGGLALILCWLVGMADSYRIGKTLEDAGT